MELKENEGFLRYCEMYMFHSRVRYTEYLDMNLQSVSCSQREGFGAPMRLNVRMQSLSTGTWLAMRKMQRLS